MLGVGALLLVSSVCAVVTFLLAPLLRSENTLGENTAVGSIAAVFVGYGAVLALTGLGLVKARGTAPFYLPSPVLVFGAFLVVLLLGQGILALGVATAYLFPIWHVLASLLFPLAVLAYAVRRLPAVSARSMLAQFAWGGLVTILLALLFELIIGGILVVIALIGIAVVLGGRRMTELGQALSEIPTDSQRVIEIVTQEPLAMLIAGVTAVVLFIVLVPALEELLKAAGPAILMARRVRANFRPTRSNAVLWGLAAGAGYAFTENLFNGQGSLSASGSVITWWGGTMLLRAGTSLMHMVATATVAAGWFEILVEAKPLRFGLLLAAATAAHGIWNTGALLLGGTTVLPGANEIPSAPTFLTVCVLGVLLLLFVGGLVWLRVLLQWASGLYMDRIERRML